MSYSSSFHQKIKEHNETKMDLPTIDAHLHLVNFLQEGEGLEKLIQEMDKAKIDKTVLFGLPVMKKWDYFEPQKPKTFLDDESKCYYYSATDFSLANEYQKLPHDHQGRIAPLLCGFNPTDCNAVTYVEKMFQDYPFWRVAEFVIADEGKSCQD